MKRAFIFLLLGPTAVAIAGSWAAFAAGVPGYFVQFLALALFFLTFLVGVLAGLADGYLARTTPVLLRAPLTAMVGATVSAGMAFAFLHCLLPPPELMFLPLGGAVCMGACSLLANEYGTWRRSTVATAT
jgi:peptidoglycan/LPS O-acetylase OafA/YrhL